MKKKPYVGVTGFMSPDEVYTTLKDIDFKSANRLLMVGVLVSQKTMLGDLNKWPGRYPKVDTIRKIFSADENCLNLVHYNTKATFNLCQQLIDVTNMSGSNFHGFQLNIAWPSMKELELYKSLHPEKQIVLQIGAHAFDIVEHQPAHLAKKIKHYEGLIDYILLDPSGGLGKPFDPAIAKDYLYELQKFESIGLGVAGGLSPTTIELLEPLVKTYPDLSIDAEGRLRTPQPEDALHVTTTRNYIQKALDIFSVST